MSVAREAGVRQRQRRRTAKTEQPATAYKPEEETWATGVALFGAVVMIMTGVFQAVTGLVAGIQKDFFVATRGCLFQLDVTTWGGWIHSWSECS